ncbi:MAG: DNA repair protein RecN [Clostridium sp.]|nr:DNA repair protein RecN [Clostridium sp.]
MLRKLNVQDFALMDHLELSFTDGFTVLTGETGAGKSILIDAISYVMGTKFNREFIRSGETKTSVEAEFDMPTQVVEILEREQIPMKEHLILFRENSSTGKSIATVNGKAVLISTLKEISPYLLDIHGQHNNQNLLDSDNHLDYLDEYGDIRQSNEFSSYQDLYRKIREKERKLVSLTRNNEREKVMEFLEYQVQEIKKHHLNPEEEEELMAKEKMLSHAQKIGEALISAQKALSDEQLDSLEHAVRSLQSIEEVYSEAKDIAQIIEDSFFSLTEARRDLVAISGEVYFDSNELDDINGRLFIYEAMQKKYGKTTQDVLVELERMEEELYELSHAEDLIADLKNQIIALKSQALEAGAELSVLRKQAAAELSSKINAELKFVGLGKADFSPFIQEGEAFTEVGTDQVHFYISTNTGEPKKPLEKVVSGGELSRIMLALKAAFIDREGTPTVIFDEIDTGISGSIAQAVGEKMHHISEVTQVLCVTHLPQIASWSDHHLIAKKEEKKGRTFSQVIHASEDDKVMEIAKMLAGAKVTEAILANAKDLILTTNQRKS